MGSSYLVGSQCALCRFGRGCRGISHKAALPCVFTYEERCLSCCGQTGLPWSCLIGRPYVVVAIPHEYIIKVHESINWSTSHLSQAVNVKQTQTLVLRGTGGNCRGMAATKGMAATNPLVEYTASTTKGTRKLQTRKPMRGSFLGATQQLYSLWRVVVATSNGGKPRWYLWIWARSMQSSCIS